MGLRLTVRPQERVIVNGSILRNVGKSRITLEVENRSDVLRGDEIITESEATTPGRRLCYYIQVALASPDDRKVALERASTAMADLQDAIGGSQGGHLDDVRDRLSHGDLYAAMKGMRPVIKHEEKLLSLVNEEE